MKSTREAVLDIAKEQSDAKRHILCDLNGIDYDFFLAYAPIAQFEQDIIDGICVITGFNLITNPRSEKPDLGIFFYNELEDYNASFGVGREDSDGYGSVFIKGELVNEFLLSEISKAMRYQGEYNPLNTLYEIYG